jgi:DNA-binding transcriptional ArsR family regulator
VTPVNITENTGAARDRKGRQIGAPTVAPAIEVDPSSVTAQGSRRGPTRTNGRADFFRALSHPVRQGILENVKDEASASDLSDRDGLGDVDLALISHHLKELAHLGLVRASRTEPGKTGRTTKQLYALTSSGEIALRMVELATKVVAP